MMKKTSLLIWASSLLFLSLPFVAGITIRFEDPTLNYWLFIVIALAIQLSASWVAVLAKGITRWVFLLITLLSFLPVCFAILFNIFSISSYAKDGKDLSFLLINEEKLNQHYYRIYRTNGGATTNFGLVLRKEKPIIDGLNVVTYLKSFEPASKGYIKINSKNTAIFIVEPNGFGQDEQRFEFKY